MREERPSAETGRQWYVLREASDTLAGDRPEGPTQVVDAFGHGRVEGEKSHAVPQGQWAPPLDALVEDGVERPFLDSSKALRIAWCGHVLEAAAPGLEILE